MIKKIILIKLLFLLSAGLLGQINNHIEKPKNDNNIIHYNSDRSISFEHGNKFSPDQISMLIQIFQKADKWADYCEDSSKVNIIKVITTIYGYNFGYVFDTNLLCHFRSSIEIRSVNRKSCIYDSDIPRRCNNKFVNYLTKDRDEFNKNTKIYNDYVKMITNKLN